MDWRNAPHGARLCFWGGGCDTRDVLPLAMPEDIRRHVLTANM